MFESLFSVFYDLFNCLRVAFCLSLTPHVLPSSSSGAFLVQRPSFYIESGDFEV